ncbi:MAG: hypothetical protein ACTSPW_16145, partial [Promethearchaeota archaeon]
MRLINNSNDSYEISAFTKEELLDIKKNFSNFKNKENSEELIKEFLEKSFPKDTIEFSKEYISKIKDFCQKYLSLKINKQEENSIFKLYDLKSYIIEELKKILNSIVNLKLNVRNVKRFAKSNNYLEELIEELNSLVEPYEDLINLLEKLENKPNKKYLYEKYLWVETNKIKNPVFKTKLPANSELVFWEEFKELYDFLEEKYKKQTKKKKIKKDTVLRVNFNDIYNHFYSKQNGKIELYTDILYLLNINKIFIIDDENYFVNVVEKKEIIQRLKKFIQSILKEAFQDNFQDIIKELEILNENYELEESGKKIKINILLEKEINTVFPQFVNMYINGLEQKYQSIINQGDDPVEYKNIISFYTEKMDSLYELTEQFENYLLRFEVFLRPYDDVISPIKKTTSNIQTEILRRKDEYIYYLKTVKNERLRDNIRSFIQEKISEVNNLIEEYQDEASLIVRKEFPQLKKIRTILTDYKEKIDEIKEEVFKKLDQFKEKDVDLYQIIKHWEDNFTRKKQQLSFILSLLLNKLYRNFKDLIEEEGLIFESITEIKEKTEIEENELPLNFAISQYLADKMSDDELNERISEIRSKINKLTSEIELYQKEANKLEEILAERVRRREGISSSKVQCTVCHKYIDFANEKIIKCPFCDSVFHYLCVAFWLSKYNSCPMCNNQFLDPNSGM